MQKNEVVVVALQQEESNVSYLMWFHQYQFLARVHPKSRVLSRNSNRRGRLDFISEYEHII